MLLIRGEVAGRLSLSANSAAGIHRRLDAVMPQATCRALGLEVGARYLAGATQAKRDLTRISRAIVSARR